jgi:hypothetical protein
MCLPDITTSPRNASIKNSVVIDSSNMIRKRRLTFAPEISKVIGTVISREDYSHRRRKEKMLVVGQGSIEESHPLPMPHPYFQGARPTLYQVD